MGIINTPSLMIVGTNSGCGKTTVTCGLLKALVHSETNIISFKSGPDYIDPMFHTKALKIPARNLDLFLLGEEKTKSLFAKNAKGKDFALLEGAMGIYDGKGFEEDLYSANHLARVLDVPQILVVDVKGKSLSLVAEIYGFLHFQENNIQGVILNRCSKAMYESYKNMIENKLNVKVYGYMPRVEGASISSRHLGLVTADEIQDIEKKLGILGNQALESLDMEGIFELGEQKRDSLTLCTVSSEKEKLHSISKEKPRIAVAKDQAFCFYYEDSLALLEELGAQLVYFSPLDEEVLPEDVSGIILGGGYPEEYAARLEQNTSMRREIKEAYERKVPIYAECGGFIYLGNGITLGEKQYSFCGVVDSDFYMTDQLVRFGYSTLISKEDNMLMRKGDAVPCHEFHYSDGTFCGDGLCSKKSETRAWTCGVMEETLFALYPHIHFESNVDMAKGFILACTRYKKGRN